MEPELVADYQCETGEGPIWHPTEKRLYWVDIPRGRVFRYDPASGEHEQCYQGTFVGGLTVQADGALLLFMDRGAVAVWRDGDLEHVIDELPDERESRFNDVFADSGGRVFCGTMPTPDRLGRLYRLDPDGSIRVVLENIGCPNGMGLTLDRKRMYFTDSRALKIYLFDYDEETGGLSNQRVFVETPEGYGDPDGMTVDADSHVWSARWDDWAVYRYSPDGVEERRVRIPTKQPASVIFGGDDYSDMYVATAGGHDRAENGATAGALYRVRTGIQGRPEFYSRIGL